MQRTIIDSHIHLDVYQPRELGFILNHLIQYHVEALIAVSVHLDSSKENLKLSEAYSKIKPAFGFHPEQTILPTDDDVNRLVDFMNVHKDQMVAVGEVGLPYYTRKKNPDIQLEPYVELLEVFMKEAKALDKPIVLHAVYEDAPLVCDLLEKYSIEKAHFHWFKGDKKTVKRMIDNGYFISFTPDVLYEKEIRELAKMYPLENMMVETDGPWPFEGPFKNKLTHPRMIHDIVEEIAVIKSIEMDEVYQTLLGNTKGFYNI